MQSCYMERGKKVQKGCQKLICTLKQKRSICCNCKSTFPMIKILGTNHFFFFAIELQVSFCLKIEITDSVGNTKVKESKKKDMKRYERKQKSIVYLQKYIEKLR